MTLSSLRGHPSLTSVMVKAIGDLVHQLAVSAATVDPSIFFRQHQLPNTIQHYLRSWYGDWRGMGKQECGFSIYNSGGDKWMRVALAYPDRYVEDVQSTRRITSLKRNFTITRDESDAGLPWTDFLYRNPNYYEALLATLTFAVKTLNNLSTNGRHIET